MGAQGTKLVLGVQATMPRATLTYQNLFFGRVPINSILGFKIRTYRKVGFGSLRQARAARVWDSLIEQLNPEASTPQSPNPKTLNPKAPNPKAPQKEFMV